MILLKNYKCLKSEACRIVGFLNHLFASIRIRLKSINYFLLITYKFYYVT